MRRAPALLACAYGGAVDRAPQINNKISIGILCRSRGVSNSRRSTARRLGLLIGSHPATVSGLYIKWAAVSIDKFLNDALPVAVEMQ